MIFQNLLWTLASYEHLIFFKFFGAKHLLSCHAITCYLALRDRQEREDLILVMAKTSGGYIITGGDKPCCGVSHGGK